MNSLYYSAKKNTSPSRAAVLVTWCALHVAPLVLEVHVRAARVEPGGVPFEDDPPMPLAKGGDTELERGHLVPRPRRPRPPGSGLIGRHVALQRGVERGSSLRARLLGDETPFKCHSRAMPCHACACDVHVHVTMHNIDTHMHNMRMHMPQGARAHLRGGGHLGDLARGDDSSARCAYGWRRA